MFLGGSWTVFAPTNQAFSELPVDLMTRESVPFSHGERRLDDLLMFHTSDTVVLYKKDLPCKAGSNLFVSPMGRKSRTLCVRNIPKYQKGTGNPDGGLPEIVKFDIEACNGVIHVVDRVILFDTIAV